jgi:hypothetical protein
MTFPRAASESAAMRVTEATQAGNEPDSVEARAFQPIERRHRGAPRCSITKPSLSHSKIT